MHLSAPYGLFIVNNYASEQFAHVSIDLQVSGAPNDGFLPNALKRSFRLSGVLLKLCRLILGCAKKILSVRFF